MAGTSSTVLGKRTHHSEPTLSPKSPTHTQSNNNGPLTPEPTPKRPRVSLLALDGSHNKENIPPLSGETDINLTPRALRRQAAESETSPSRTQTTPRRPTSSSQLAVVTPATAISQLSITTPPPTPPSSLQPTYIRARALLRATCNSEHNDMAGRITERATLAKFLAAFGDSHPSSLYVSGSPGTGKTALVHSVIQEHAPALRVIVVNCMAFDGVNALWDHLLTEVNQGKKTRATRTKGRKALDNALVKLKEQCIIVLDELDHIAGSVQVLKSIFSLPQSNPAVVRIIGIANTHTLTSSLSAEDIASVQTLHFAPYTSPQLVEIIKSRLCSLYAAPDARQRIGKLLPEPTLMLLSKKVATQTGDVRSLFEILRTAIDIAVGAVADSKDENLLNTPSPTVTPSHILAALKSYSSSALKSNTRESSEIVAKVRDLGLQGRVVLLSMLIASKRVSAGLPLQGSSPSSSVPSTPSKRSRVIASSPLALPNLTGIDSSQMYSFYSSMLTRSDSGLFDPIGRSEFRDLVGMLDGIGLVRISSISGSASFPSTPSKNGRRVAGRSTSSKSFSAQSLSEDLAFADGIRLEEVERGLGVSDDSPTPTDVMQEEMLELWNREESKLNRDLKAKERTGITPRPLDTFDEAIEA